MNKKGWPVLFLAIAALMALAPFASQLPDPVQNLLGLPGGSTSWIKALGGVLATVGLVLAIGQIIKQVKAHKS
jgi:hypothetical protein